MISATETVQTQTLCSREEMRRRPDNLYDLMGEPTLIVSLIEDERPALCCYYDDVRLFHDWEMNPTDNNIRLLKEVLADNGIASGR